MRSVLRRAHRLASASRDGTLGYSDRFMLQRAFARDLERIEDVARYASLRGHALLAGEGLLELQASPRHGRIRSFAIPDVTVQGLGLGAAKIETHRDIAEAVASIQAAIRNVTSDLRAAQALRRQLKKPLRAHSITDR